MVVTGIVDAVAHELMLFAGVGLMVGGIDDLVVDALFVLRRLVRGSSGLRRLADLPAAPPTRFAIMVATWQEAPVIGAMLTAMLARYRHHYYDVFVAAYPNDRTTIEAIVQGRGA